MSQENWRDHDACKYLSFPLTGGGRSSQIIGCLKRTTETQGRLKPSGILHDEKCTLFDHYVLHSGVYNSPLRRNKQFLFSFIREV